MLELTSVQTWKELVTILTPLSWQFLVSTQDLFFIHFFHKTVLIIKFLNNSSLDSNIHARTVERQKVHRLFARIPKTRLLTQLLTR